MSKIFAYTVGTLGTARETVPYAYTNSAWKDQLTSYDGESITYDASGNPTNYLGATLVWEGQRLKSYTPKASSSGHANSYVYSYDENGIRTRKTIGNTVTDYYYNGTLLMGTVKTTTNSDGSTTTSKLRFSYDADGKVVAVNYNGNYYYYLRNAQSDIVKLIDKTGATVVEYTYDSWGKLLSTSGSLASTLGKNNPFRYRGYVYDEETGFYYLQSRYYNPEVGRFISSDVLLSTGQGVLGHNAYGYCLNNPCRLSDSEGASATLAIGGTAIAFTSVFVLALCVCLIIDLATNQEQSLAQQFVSAIQTIVIDSIATVQAIWYGIVLSNKNQFFGKPGEIKDGPEDYKKTHIGEDGRADMQQHNTNHSNPKLHPNPHWHKVDWSPNGNPILSPNIPGNWPLCGCNVNIRIWRRNHVFYV